VSDIGRRAIRVALVGTGTGIGKTHVACALVGYWSAARRVVGLKPIETGVRPASSDPVARRRRDANGARTALSDQEQLAEAAQMFHVKHSPVGRAGRDGKMFHVKQSDPAARIPRPGRRSRRPTTHGAPGLPTRSLFAFADPVSPHLAAREAGVRIDLGAIERWVSDHEAPITVVETAGALFSPIGYGTTNFDLVQSLRPDIVLLIAPDRLGVLHELTTTLGLCAARGGPDLAILLSAPPRKDTSTGRNAAEIEELGIGRVVADFPRAAPSAAATQRAASQVDEWMIVKLGSDRKTF
jgi:dethiobiotin synthetase